MAHLVITLYDIKDIGRLVEAIRGRDGDLLVQLFGSGNATLTTMHNFHVPRGGIMGERHGAKEWIANAKIEGR